MLEIIGTCFSKVDGKPSYVMAILNEGNQRSMFNALPHILNRFLVGNQQGINWKANVALSPMVGVYTVATGSPLFFSAKDVHFIESYTWGIKKMEQLRLITIMSGFIVGFDQLLSFCWCCTGHLVDSAHWSKDDMKETWLPSSSHAPATKITNIYIEIYGWFTY